MGAVIVIKGKLYISLKHVVNMIEFTLLINDTKKQKMPLKVASRRGGMNRRYKKPINF